MYMYKKLLAFHHLILSKYYVAHFAGQLLWFTDQIFVNCRPTSNQRNFCNIKFIQFSLWRQYLQLTCTKELFLEAVSHSFSSKGCPANTQQIYRRRPIRTFDFKKSCVALLHGCCIVSLLRVCRTPF